MPAPDTAPDGTPPETCRRSARPRAPAPAKLAPEASNWVSTNEPLTVNSPTTSIAAEPDTCKPIWPFNADDSVTWALAGRSRDKLEALARAHGENPDLSQMIGRLVDHGLRAQARTGNLLTGQLYVALDFIPKTPKVAFDPQAKPLTIPTVPGSFDKLQEQMAEIVDKLNKIPFDSIGRNLDQTLAGLNATLKQVNGETLPAFKDTLHGVQQTMGTANDALAGDSPLQQNLGATLEQVQRMARSLRVLTDYLGGHPESLIRGRRPDAKPADMKPANTTPAAIQPVQGSTP